MKNFIILLLMAAIAMTAIGADTKYGSSWYGGSVVIYPPDHPGKAFLVNSANANASDNNPGLTWDAPLATLAAAIAKCTDDASDVIYLAPGHSETWNAAATSATLDKSTATIVGLGTGLAVPSFTMTHVDATLTVSDVSCRLYNLKFVSNLDNVKVLLTLAATADGATVENCVFRDSAANKDYLVGISAASGCTDIKLLGNNFHTTAAAGGNNAINLVGTNTNSVIAGNVAYGKFATGALLGSAACLGLEIRDNQFVNAEEAIAIALHASSTGLMANNYLAGYGSTIAAVLTGDNLMWCFENYIADEYARSGVLNPAVVTAD